MKKNKSKFKGIIVQKKSFVKIIENKIIPAISKFTNCSVILTIRDTFCLMLPLIIVGSIGILGSNFVFGGGHGSKGISNSIIGWIAWIFDGVKISKNKNALALWELQGNYIDAATIGKHLFSYIETATIGCFSIYTAFFIAWRWASLHEVKNSILAGITSVAAFLIVSQADQRFFDSSGLLISILSSFLSAWLFAIFDRKEKIKIKMPESVPKSVSSGFNALLPILFVLLIVSSINVMSYCIGYYANLEIKKGENTIIKPGEYGFAGLVYAFISAPFISFASRNGAGLGIGLVYVFAYTIIGWFGVHGGSVLNGIFLPLWVGLVQNNYDLIQSHGDKFHENLSAINWAFLETYCMSTGVGTTGGLIIATMIFSRKNKKFMQINKIAIPAAIFNINEPITFGYPLVLDPVLGIPEIFVMPIILIYSWVFVGPLGWVAKSYIYVPWTMPIGLGAFFSTGLDWRALILSLSALPLAFLFYTPFVLLKNRFDAANEIKNNKFNEKIAVEESDDIFLQAKK